MERVFGTSRRFRPLSAGLVKPKFKVRRIFSGLFSFCSRRVLSTYCRLLIIFLKPTSIRFLSGNTKEWFIVIKAIFLWKTRRYLSKQTYNLIVLKFWLSQTEPSFKFCTPTTNFSNFARRKKNRHFIWTLERSNGLTFEAEPVASSHV